MNNWFNKIISFTQNQIADIRKGRPLIKQIIIFSLIIIFIPFALIIRLIKPLIHIRFGKIIIERIGHLAFEPELYLCEKDMGIQKKRVLDLFYCGSTTSNYGNLKTSNSTLLRMWRRKLTILPRLIIPLAWANRFLPFSSNYIVPLHSNKHEDVHGLLDKLPQHIAFNHEEELYGETQLKSIGIPAGAKFICFYSRDSAYLDSLIEKNTTEYHSYRNSNIQNYILALNSLVKRGYFLLRMGSVVKESLEVNNTMIIDYASNYRSDFMDVYLLSKCTFFITTNSGPCAIATIFRQPNAFVNVSPFLGASTISRKEDMFIPKKYWSNKEERFLTFDEILTSDAANFFATEQFDDLGIELKENSSQEINDLSIEMDQRLSGTWVTSEAEIHSQQEYARILMKNGYDIRMMPRIGTAFLLSNLNLLNY